MKKGKLMIATAITIVAIMLSSQIAVASTNKVDAGDLEQTSNIDCFRLIGDIIPLDSRLGSTSIISSCFSYYNNNEFRNKFNAFRDNFLYILRHKYDDLFELSKIVYNTGKAFDFSVINSNILSLDENNIMGSIQDLLMQPDSLEDFLNIHMVSVTDGNGLLTNEGIEIGEYEEIDYACETIADISMIWIIPLTMLLGAVGAIIANCVTVVLFSPFLVPAWIYVSINEYYQDNPPNENEPVDISELMKEVYEGGYLAEAGVYILGRILVNVLKECQPQTYSEKAPSLFSLEVNQKFIYRNEPTIVHVWLIDYDKLNTNPDPNHIDEYRDYVQAGLDWDNNGIIDQWTPLSNDHDRDYRYFAVDIQVEHIFKTSGDHVVSVTPRDQWGVCGETKQVTLNVWHGTPKSISTWFKWFPSWLKPLFSFF